MSSPRPAHKNKTVAALLALIAGFGGAHRMYLRGTRDKWALLHCASGLAVILTFVLAPHANPFYMLLPLIVSHLIGLLEGLVIGLMPDEKFDARYNAGSGRQSDSQWPLALILVATLMVGATGVIATLSRLFDLLYTGGSYG
ncbi:MAG TPA: hypothetical protein VFS02_22090 [Telluria sp.]|nr:hypothetical protein [Telluria sp.]